jgi:uncharacterized membrane-anchored protein
MSRWRNVLVGAGLLLALVVVNLGIAGREALLRDGTRVLLELAPVDPRSLMQGDYMALEFALGGEIGSSLGTSAQTGSGDGYAILALDERGVASLRRVQASPTPRNAGEIALRYRLRDGRVRIVTNAWFFAEGEARRFEGARHGELRVGDDGEALLVALRDAQLRAL